MYINICIHTCIYIYIYMYIHIYGCQLMSVYIADLVYSATRGAGIVTPIHGAKWSKLSKISFWVICIVNWAASWRLRIRMYIYIHKCVYIYIYTYIYIYILMYKYTYIWVVDQIRAHTYSAEIRVLKSLLATNFTIPKMGRLLRISN